MNIIEIIKGLLEIFINFVIIYRLFFVTFLICIVILIGEYLKGR